MYIFQEFRDIAQNERPAETCRFILPRTLSATLGVQQCQPLQAFPMTPTARREPSESVSARRFARHGDQSNRGAPSRADGSTAARPKSTLTIVGRTADSRQRTAPFVAGTPPPEAAGVASRYGSRPATKVRMTTSEQDGIDARTEGRASGVWSIGSRSPDHRSERGFTIRAMTVSTFRRPGLGEGPAEAEVVGWRAAGRESVAVAPPGWRFRVLDSGDLMLKRGDA